MIDRPVLKAHQLRSIGPGQRWLVELEMLSDGRVLERLNPGTPEPEQRWQEIGRWIDLDEERARLRRDGWQLD
ncbi:MAG TPA: hypothetical protein VJQ09_04555 [Candidatus Limnocylindria bacterium]|nr:hypothetical protein [Candidatus Limnocylindria bacterium]